MNQRCCSTSPDDGFGFRRQLLLIVSRTGEQRQRFRAVEWAKFLPTNPRQCLTSRAPRLHPFVGMVHHRRPSSYENPHPARVRRNANASLARVSKLGWRRLSPKARLCLIAIRCCGDKAYHSSHSRSSGPEGKAAPHESSGCWMRPIRNSPRDNHEDGHLCLLRHGPSPPRPSLRPR